MKGTRNERRGDGRTTGQRREEGREERREDRGCNKRREGEMRRGKKKANKILFRSALSCSHVLFIDTCSAGLHLP